MAIYHSFDLGKSKDYITIGDTSEIIKNLILERLTWPLYKECISGTKKEWRHCKSMLEHICGESLYEAVALNLKCSEGQAKLAVKEFTERAGSLLDAGGIEQHIVEYGVTEFIVGHYGGFDRMAEKAVIAATAQHPEITLSMRIPYHPAERPVELPQGFDNTFYPPGMEKVPRRLAIVRANRYVVDHVDYLIAYAWQPGSNARELVEYANNRGTVCVTRLPRSS